MVMVDWQTHLGRTSVGSITLMLVYGGYRAVEYVVSLRPSAFIHAGVVATVIFSAIFSAYMVGSVLEYIFEWGPQSETE